MRIYLTRWFARFARKERISTDRLRMLVERAEQGLIDADLGGNVIKLRLARPGQGRSGGYRVFVAIRRGSRAFLIYGFAKSDTENLTPAELTEYKTAAVDLLALTGASITRLLDEGTLVEIDANGQTTEK